MLRRDRKVVRRPGVVVALGLLDALISHEFLEFCLQIAIVEVARWRGDAVRYLILILARVVVCPSGWADGSHVLIEADREAEANATRAPSGTATQRPLPTA